jgi:hypothetical protein
MIQVLHLQVVSHSTVQSLSICKASTARQLKSSNHPPQRPGKLNLRFRQESRPFITQADICHTSSRVTHGYGPSPKAIICCDGMDKPATVSRVSISSSQYLSKIGSILTQSWLHDHLPTHQTPICPAAGLSEPCPVLDYHAFGHFFR